MNRDSRHEAGPTGTGLRESVLAAVPAALGVLAGIAWRLSGETRGISAFVPLPTLVLVSGVLLSLALLVRVWVRRRIARARREEKERIEARHGKERQQFLARLDHELKNPLTAILAASASGGQDAPALVSAQARRMGVLVTDLRRLSDLETAPLQDEDVDLEEAARDALDAARAVVADAREFELVFPTAPWPLPHVRGDADLLYSAIQNVVMNAVKYSDDGASIEVRGMQSEGVVSIEVADTGIGIPEADRETVWSQLARGSNAVDRPGAGMGLPLVKLVIERHGGSVRLTSREGVGTSVVMNLPVPAPTPSP